MKILFWNTHNNENINPILTEIILEERISVVALAEYAADISNLVELLGENGVYMSPYFTLGCDRIKILGTVRDVSPAAHTRYASIQVFNGSDIFCCIHLPSKTNADSPKRGIAVSKIVREIENLEAKYGTKNTIIVGDFNVNPYEPECLEAQYFHGIPVSEDAEKMSRVVMEETFNMFYNPMWNLLGDFDSPPGTYYLSTNEVSCPFWNLFDQVIIRPHIRHRFEDSSLRIVTSTEMIDLLDDNGHPNRRISDHLPIVFEIKEANHE